jgi:hypothetical protein
MALPGFSAHTSLRPSRRAYLPRAPVGPSASTRVAPAANGCAWLLDLAQGELQAALAAAAQGDDAAYQAHFAEFQSVLSSYSACGGLDAGRRSA